MANSKMTGDRYLRLRNLEISLKKRSFSTKEISEKYNISRCSAWRDINLLSTILSIKKENGRYYI